MAKYRVSQQFLKLPDSSLISFTENVVDHLTGNSKFPEPPVELSDLTAAKVAFANALAASLAGGPELTAAKNFERAILEGLLQQESTYVQGLAAENLADLLSSGYDATSKNRAQIELPQPIIASVVNVMSTQLGLVVLPIPTSKAIEVRIKFGTNDYVGAGVFSSRRRIRLSNLTPGTVYTIQVRAIGGITGYSDWSDPISHMAT